MSERPREGPFFLDPAMVTADDKRRSLAINTEEFWPHRPKVIAETAAEEAENSGQS
jgi:hypothetical protein